MEHAGKKSTMRIPYKVSDFEFASQLFLLNACLTLLPNESKETSVSSTKLIEHIITVEVQGKKL